MASDQTENINDSFFDGNYKDIWRSIIPEALTKAEVDFLIQESNLKDGNKVLDLMCGYGRHSLALARKVIEVTAIDNLPVYIREIKGIAEKENLPVSAFQQNVIQFQPQKQYDLVICMGNSLSFFNWEDSIKLFSMIASCLEKGRKFISNTWMITEIVLKQFKEKIWNYAGETKFLADSKFLFFPTRIEAESIFIAPDGKTEVKKGIDFIYSLNEMENLHKQSGFTI